jgi:hypothetical protein
MGGLINGSTVKGDLWMCETGPGEMSCYPVATTSEGPGPRVGHASLLVGNAFIVFGGDTKMDEGDVLDDTLYLLNTCETHPYSAFFSTWYWQSTATKQWSRALPAGPRPPGRYGHTLNILGSKLYIFGGQVEGYFFNDLVAFDLNALQQASNRWEVLIQNTIDGGPPHGQIPPARTNHTMITWGDRLYLWGLQSSDEHMAMANFWLGLAALTASHGSTMSGHTILTQTLGPSLNALDISLQLVKDMRRLSSAM